MAMQRGEEPPSRSGAARSGGPGRSARDRHTRTHASSPPRGGFWPLSWTPISCKRRHSVVEPPGCPLSWSLRASQRVLAARTGSRRPMICSAKTTPAALCFIGHCFTKRCSVCQRRECLCGSIVLLYCRCPQAISKYC